MPARSVLVIGYGNPGRRDDGLGPALAAALEALPLPGVTVDANYQLFVEDAAAVAEHDVVIFADAALAGREPFSFQRAIAGAPAAFSTHSVGPEAVLAWSEQLFHRQPDAYVLGIRGYEFDDFGEGLSARAQANLAAAASFVQSVLRTGGFEQAARRLVDSLAADSPQPAVAALTNQGELA